MSLPEPLSTLTGIWLGNKKVLQPGQPDQVSTSLANITLSAQGRFITWHYTWDVGGTAQDGLLIAGLDDSGQASGAWVDSWHNGDRMMLLTGAAAGDGGLNLNGSFPAPPGPDWGWRIHLLAESADTLKVSMYIISPEGEESLGVEVVYTRQS